MSFFDLGMNTDERDPLLGWSSGYYSCKCDNCGESYLGYKRSYNCSDCAYNFTEQLEYERLWSWATLHSRQEYVFRKADKRIKGRKQ